MRGWRRLGQSLRDSFTYPYHPGEEAGLAAVGEHHHAQAGLDDHPVAFDGGVRTRLRGAAEDELLDAPAAGPFGGDALETGRVSEQEADGGNRRPKSVEPPLHGLTVGIRNMTDEDHPDAARAAFSAR